MGFITNPIQTFPKQKVLMSPQSPPNLAQAQQSTGQAKIATETQTSRQSNHSSKTRNASGQRPRNPKSVIKTAKSTPGTNEYHLNQYFTSISGYDVPKSQDRVTLNCPLDHTLFEDPLVAQHKFTLSGVNDQKTQVTLIHPELNYFAESLKTQVIEQMISNLTMATGGTGAVTTIFSEHNILQYFNSVWKALFTLIELMSIQAWDAEGDHRNVLMRTWSRQLSSPELLELRNKLAEKIATLCLPAKMVDYAYFMLQNYTINEFSNSCLIRFNTVELLTTTTGQTEAYVAHVNAVITDLNPSTYDIKRMPALIKKMNPLFEIKDLNKLMAPSCSTSYSVEFSDIYNNVSGIVQIGSASEESYYPAIIGDKTSAAPAAFESSVDNVKCTALEHMVEKFNFGLGSNCPLLVNFANKTLISVGTDKSNCVNLYQSDSGLVQWNNAHEMGMQISNRFINVYAFSSQTHWAGIRRGNAQGLYEISYRNSQLAQNNFVKYIFS